MQTLSEIKHLISKEIKLEWRQRYAINGVILYLLSMIFLIYLSFTSINSITWITLYWIIIFFASINAVAKSFILERPARMLYYYTICSAQAIIFSKSIYNFLLLLVLSAIGLLIFIAFAGNPIGNMNLFLLTMLLGSMGFSFALTMTSAIASKGNNKSTLMSVLSFPIIIPVLLLLIKLSKAALAGETISENIREILTLSSINLIVISTAFLLFPYLWRD
ncbi:MAG: heme exporter protein CcmB [Bacteroidetes bacterium]|nr:heme exporter protein CcmB [Bacteroidota bacterium]